MNRRSARLAATLAATLLAIAAIAIQHGRAEEGTARAALAFAPGSELWMEGKSTVHDWESRTKTVNVVFTRPAGQAEPTATAGIEALVRGNGIRGVDVQIPVTTLHSSRNGLDKNMLKSLRAEKYPTIRFRMARYTVVSPATADTMLLRVEGVLTVTGAEKNVTLEARAWKSDKGEWIEGVQPLNMTDFGIKPPTMMLGTLKVADRVEIHYRLLLAPGSGVAGMLLQTEK